VAKGAKKEALLQKEAKEVDRRLRVEKMGARARARLRKEGHRRKEEKMGARARLRKAGHLGKEAKMGARQARLIVAEGREARGKEGHRTVAEARQVGRGKEDPQLAVGARQVRRAREALPRAAVEVKEAKAKPGLQPVAKGEATTAKEKERGAAKLLMMVVAKQEGKAEGKEEEEEEGVRALRRITSEAKKTKERRRQLLRKRSPGTRQTRLARPRQRGKSSPSSSN